MSVKIVNAIVNDALGTTRRIRDDVRHLKELGQRAKIVGTIAARQTKAKIEDGIERAADALIDLESAFRSAAPHMPDGKRGRR